MSEVKIFYDVLQETIELLKANTSKIWNMDETGINIVYRPAKIIVTKGVLTVGKISSGEHGRNITIVCAVVL